MSRLSNTTEVVVTELVNAIERFPKFNSAHEGYAILLEEMDELWEEVRKNPRNRSEAAMAEEAVQVAAMAIRFVMDVCGSYADITHRIDRPGVPDTRG